MSRRQKDTNKVARYRRTALQAVSDLAKGDTRPKNVHRFRTHLRRLQAYLELIGKEQEARKMGKCVSMLSSLRTLQVFLSYLERRNAPKSDLRKVKTRIRARLEKLARKRTAQKLERRIRRYALLPNPAPLDWLDARMGDLRRSHTIALRDLIAEATAKPKRKILHALRLEIKTVRYQEEWVLGRPYCKPELAERLKRAQAVLGNYEERSEFLKIGRKLKLKAIKKINKDRRQARRRARAVPNQVAQIIEELGGRRLRLVEP